MVLNLSLLFPRLSSLKNDLFDSSILIDDLKKTCFTFVNNGGRRKNFKDLFTNLTSCTLPKQV